MPSTAEEVSAETRKRRLSRRRGFEVGVGLLQLHECLIPAINRSKRERTHPRDTLCPAVSPCAGDVSVMDQMPEPLISLVPVVAMLPPCRPRRSSVATARSGGAAPSRWRLAGRSMRLWWDRDGKRWPMCGLLAGVEGSGSKGPGGPCRRERCKDQASPDPRCDRAAARLIHPAAGSPRFVGWKSAAHSTMRRSHGVGDGFVAPRWIAPLRGLSTLRFPED